MKTQKLARLNAVGIAHYVLPLVVMVLIGVTGAYLVVSSNANSVKTKKAASGKMAISAVNYKCKHAGGEARNCHYVKSKDSLWVSAGADEAVFRQNLKCNGKSIPANGTAINFGTARTLKCSPGAYFVQLQDHKAYTYKMDAKDSDIVYVKSGQTSRTKLGSSL